MQIDKDVLTIINEGRVNGNLIAEVGDIVYLPYKFEGDYIYGKVVATREVDGRTIVTVAWEDYDHFSDGGIKLDCFADSVYFSPTLNYRLRGKDPLDIEENK